MAFDPRGHTAYAPYPSSSSSSSSSCHQPQQYVQHPHNYNRLQHQHQSQHQHQHQYEQSYQNQQHLSHQHHQHQRSQGRYPDLHMQPAEVSPALPRSDSDYEYRDYEAPDDRYDYENPPPPSSDYVPEDQNMAGFGARRFADASRRQAEAAHEADQRRQAEEMARATQRQQEQDRRAWEDEEQRRRLAEQQQQQQRRIAEQREQHRLWLEQEANAEAERGPHGREDDVERQRREHWEHQKLQEQVAAVSPPTQAHPQHLRHYQQKASVEEQRRNVLEWYRNDKGKTSATTRPQASRENSDGSQSTDSSASRSTGVKGVGSLALRRGASIASTAVGLPYDDEGARSQDAAVFNGSALSAQYTSPQSDALRLSLAPRAFQRETIYEDDFEEAEEEELKFNAARYTHYGDHEDAPGVGPKSLFGARKSLFRATTYEPLPKARCADCGLELAFDDLANHSCEQASQPSTPSTPMTPLVPTTPSEGGPSPFLERYEQLMSGKSPESSPSGGLLLALGGLMQRSATLDERKTTLQEERKNDGLGLTPEEARPKRSNTSPAASPRVAAAAVCADPPKQSAMGVVLSLRQQIEAQRQAIREGKSPSPSTDRFEPVAGSSGPRSLPKGRNPSSPGYDTSDCCKSSKSSGSSEASSVFDNAHSPMVALTPSSSADRFSDNGRAMKDSPVRADRSLLSPTTAAEQWGRGHQVASSSALAGKTGSRRPEAPKHLDLSGLDDIMKDLNMQSTRDSGSSRAATSPAEVPRRRIGGMSSTDRKLTKKSSRSPKLCCVCMCSLRSSKRRFVEKDGQYFCAEDYKNLFLPKCKKCHEPVEKDAVRSSDGALKGIFHRSCFCCFRCDQRFEDGIFYVYENAPYCFEHYSALAGTQCAGCGNGIEGLCRQTEPGERFHPNCLTCQYEDVRKKEFCQDPLEDFYVIDGRRLCEHHAVHVQTLLEKSGSQRRRYEKRKTMLMGTIVMA